MIISLDGLPKFIYSYKCRISSSCHVETLTAARAHLLLIEKSLNKYFKSKQQYIKYCLIYILTKYFTDNTHRFTIRTRNPFFTVFFCLYIRKSNFIPVYTIFIDVWAMAWIRLSIIISFITLKQMMWYVYIIPRV